MLPQKTRQDFHIIYYRKKHPTLAKLCQEAEAYHQELIG